MEPADGARGLGVVISGLEQVTLAACSAFADSQFGAALRQRSPQTRHRENDLFGDPLITFEINGGAPIARTLKTLQMLEMSHEPIEREAIQEYVAWIGQAMQAVQRLAQMCWAPIPKRERQLIYDEDDLGPAGSPYLPASRHDETGPSLAFEGLSGSEALAAWRAVVAELRQTPCYEGAKAAGVALGEPRLHAEAVACHEATQDACLALLDGPPMTLGEALDGQRQIIRNAYVDASEDLQRAAAAIRGHSDLINHLLWAVLCAAERTEVVADLSQDDLGPMRITGHRPQQISLAMQERLWIGHSPSPFVIDNQTPCSGLYIVKGSMVQFENIGLVDIHGTRVASLELAPS
jgi:hypothetical protein